MEDVVRPCVCWRSGCAAHCSACGPVLRIVVCGCGAPDPLFAQTYNNKTALMFAAEKGSLEVCQLLVANNADINAKA